MGILESTIKSIWLVREELNRGECVDFNCKTRYVVARYEYLVTELSATITYATREHCCLVSWLWLAVNRGSPVSRARPMPRDRVRREVGRGRRGVGGGVLSGGFCVRCPRDEERATRPVSGGINTSALTSTSAMLVVDKDPARLRLRRVRTCACDVLMNRARLLIQSTKIITFFYLINNLQRNGLTSSVIYWRAVL